ncbi:MAG: biotin/lipoyl-binding protein, partial [Microthrixaceae bacterium]
MQALLAQPPKPTWWRRRSLWIGLALLASGTAAYFYWSASQQAKAAPIYVTEAAAKGNLTLRVTANGTLQPTRLVNIGSELSGTVLRVLVDVNDRVKKGQVLVELDTAKLTDQVTRSRAALASAQAQLLQTAATLKETKASLARLEEVARLSGGKVPSAAELDAARASLERAVGRRGQRPRQPRFSQGVSRHGRNQSVQGFNPLAHRRHDPDPFGGSRQCSRRVTAGGHLVHDCRRPGQAAAQGERGRSGSYL